jgi:hypothetical protein
MNPVSGLLVALIGFLLMFLTWQARGSGEIQLRTWRLRRAESPSTFQIVLILRGLFGVFLVAIAVWAVLPTLLSR